MRTWNEMMLREHPQGAGPVVGRQLRYLIDSEDGWLGGLGFAAAALQPADRDKWIGWDVEQRRAYLHTVVGMSRFLIRPSVQCRNLASKVLSMAMAALPDDFERRYNYQPWLCGLWAPGGRPGASLLSPREVTFMRHARRSRRILLGNEATTA